MSLYPLVETPFLVFRAYPWIGPADVIEISMISSCLLILASFPSLEVHETLTDGRLATL